MTSEPARNAALDAAAGDWILYIDADERVASWDRAALEPILADPRAIACTVRFRPQTGYTRYREHRLFRAGLFRFAPHAIPDRVAALDLRRSDWLVHVNLNL